MFITAVRGFLVYLVRGASREKPIITQLFKSSPAFMKLGILYGINKLPALEISIRHASETLNTFPTFFSY